MSGVQVQRRIPECFESSLRQTGQFELDLPWALSVSHLFKANGDVAVAVGPPVLAASRLSGRLVPLLNHCPAKQEVILASVLKHSTISEPHTNLILSHLHPNRK